MIGAEWLEPRVPYRLVMVMLVLWFVAIVVAVTAVVWSLLAVRCPDDEEEDDEEDDIIAAEEEEDSTVTNAVEEIVLDDEGNINWELSFIPASVHKAEITSPILRRLERMLSIRLVVGSTYFDNACKRM